MTEDPKPLTGLSPVQWKGLLAACGGLLAVSAYPYLRVTRDIFPGGGASDVSLFAGLIGASVLTWAVYVVRADSFRPLTPRRALLIPILFTGLAVTTDLVTAGRLLEWVGQRHHRWSLPLIHNLSWKFSEILFVAASVFAVVGSAIRSSQRRWLLAGVGATVLLTWVAQLPPYASGIAVIVVVLGIVPVSVGYFGTVRPT